MVILCYKWVGPCSFWRAWGPEQWDCLRYGISNYIYM